MTYNDLYKLSIQIQESLEKNQESSPLEEFDIVAVGTDEVRHWVFVLPPHRRGKGTRAVDDQTVEGEEAGELLEWNADVGRYDKTMDRNGL